MIDPSRTKRWLPLALMALVPVAASLLPGCGGETSEFHQDVKDTPQSLAEEFVFRYKALPENASEKAKAKSAAVEKAKAALPDVDAQTKSSHAEAATKKAAQPTLDGLLDDLDARIGKVQGASRADVAKAVLGAVEKDPAIREEDRAVISKRLKP
jgi:hypothetical protein